MAENTSSIYKALAKAQSEFGTVVKNRKANYGNYADLGAILDVVRPALNRNGSFLSQKVSSDSNGVTVETILAHESGESISSGPLFMPVGSVKGSQAQAFGSARTYACRYSLSSFLGIAADDDDDGRSAGMQQHAKLPHQDCDVPEDLLIKAKDAVMWGNYEEFFTKKISNDQRALLTKSGWHAQLKVGNI